MQVEPWISKAASAKFSLVLPPSNVMHISSSCKQKQANVSVSFIIRTFEWFSNTGQSAQEEKILTSQFRLISLCLTSFPQKSSLAFGTINQWKIKKIITVRQKCVSWFWLYQDMFNPKLEPQMLLWYRCFPENNSMVEILVKDIRYLASLTPDVEQLLKSCVFTCSEWVSSQT